MKFNIAIGKQHKGWRRHRSLRHVKNSYPPGHRHGRALKINLVEEPVHLSRRYALAPLGGHGQYFMQHASHDLAALLRALKR